MIVTFHAHVVSACGVFNPGDVADIPAAFAEEYVRLGYAEAVVAEETPSEPITTKRRK
jgi:hypothetical protein